MQTCSPKTRRACASAVACLTTIEYFAALADAVAKGVMNEKGIFKLFLLNLLKIRKI